jgi:hypothetical protein
LRSERIEPGAISSELMAGIYCLGADGEGAAVSESATGLAKELLARELLN